MDKDIQTLARRENVPKATITSKLIREALELQEDLALAKIAEKREAMRLKYIPDSDDIWK